MKISYLTILAATGLFSAIAIASFSRYRKGSQRKDLQNEHKDKPEYMPRQDNTLVKTTVGKRDIEVNAVTTTAESGLEGQKVRRVKKYRSDGKPMYE
jgi:hypothetical protein